MPLFGPPNIEKMKAKKDVNGLLKLLSKSKDLEQTKKAIAALGEIGDPVVVPRLIGTLQYEYFSMDMLDMGTDAYFKIKTANNELRSAAAYALGSIGDVRAVPALRKITESSVPGFFFDGSDSLARAAESALRMIGSKHAPKPTLQPTPTPQPQPKPQAAAPRQKTTKKPSLPARLPGPIPAHTYLHDGNLKEGPGNGAAEFQSALEHWNHQRYSDALDRYKKALAAGLTSVYEAAAHSNMGQIYLMQDNVAAAVDHFIKALWLNPITASVAYGCAAHLALIYEQLGMLEDTRAAVAEAQQALKLINTIISAEAAQKVKDTVLRVYLQGSQASASPAPVKKQPVPALQPAAPATLHTVHTPPQDELAKALNDMEQDDEVLRRSAAVRLRKIGSQAVEPLIQRLNHKNMAVRKSAAGILGKIGDMRAIQPLLEISLSYENKQLRAACDTALLSIGDPIYEPVVQQLAQRLHDWNGITNSADLLGRLGDPRAAGPLEEAWQAHVADSYIVKALGMLEGDAACPALVRMLAHEPSRAAAASWLVKKGEAALPALKEALGAEDEEVRKQAAKLLGKLGAMDAAQIKAVTSHPRPKPQLKPATAPCRYPQWEQVKTDPRALPPRMLSELQKAMVFIVCENGEEQAVVIVRADRGEFQTTITTATPMRLCVDFYTGRNGDVFGIYPLVLDNASDPAFKETWLSPYDDRPEFQTGDPLSAEQRKRLHLLLNQRAVWMIFIDHRDQYLWVRRVEYTPQQIQKFKEYAHKLNGYRGRTTEKTQYFALLQEYMAAVPLETLRRQFVQLFRE